MKETLHYPGTLGKASYRSSLEQVYLFLVRLFSIELWAFFE